jgi:hypothetical protein
MICEDCPPYLNINDWQQSVHQADKGVVWTPRMDYEVRRFMDGKIVAQTAALLAGSTIKRVEGRAEVLLIEAMGRIG